MIDTVGELSDWWQLADIALVGGSFIPHGGQNMIEPAAAGAAVAFGPHTHNFRDVVSLLLDEEAAFVAADPEAFGGFVQRCLKEPAYAQELGRRAAAAVATGRGATQRTADRLLQHVAKRAENGGSGP